MKVSMIRLSKRIKAAIEAIGENVSSIENRSEIDMGYELETIDEKLIELRFYANIVADFQDSDEEEHSQTKKENVND
jgi:hypothetical protein